MITTRDLAWMAGLLEGEGCFRYHETPRIDLHMTDPDVVQRAALLFGNNSISLGKCRESHHKQIFITVCTGKKAAGWMMTLYALMGQRRRQKIEDVLARWKNSPGSGAHNQTPQQRRECVLKRVAAIKAKAYARHNNKPISTCETARDLSG